MQQKLTKMLWAVYLQLAALDPRSEKVCGISQDWPPPNGRPILNAILLAHQLTINQLLPTAA
jgi:hypothetical protein